MVGGHNMQCMWRSKVNFQESVLFFYHVVLGIKLWQKVPSPAELASAGAASHQPLPRF